MNLHRRIVWPLAAAFLCARTAMAQDVLEEIIVHASLRATPAAALPQSVTVLDHDALAAQGVQHFEDVLGAIPELNWAAWTSRPRYFQVRGIGEVEQYQGATNPSVGFLIDDIDFSGVGMPATLFDTQQIEVLRGPQGTTYGANALAGLINVRTADPGSEFELNGELTGATYDTRAAGLVVGDGFDSGNGGWRLVAQRYASDGFRHNAFLDENATNGYDETTLRAKLRWQLAPGLRADLTLMHVDLDNGYDAWSVYNTYTTYTNQPGYDKSLLYNQAQLTQSTGTGTPVIASNTPSQAQHGVSVYSATVYQNDIGVVGDMANWIVNTRSTPAERAEALTVNAGTNSAFWPFVLGAEPAQPVQVARRPIPASAPTIVQAIISQVKRTFDFAAGTATATVVTDAFPEGQVLTAGDPVFGQLSGLNLLGW